MTKLLEKAFEEAAQQPESEQDSFAEWLLAELRSEQSWAETFSRSSDQLARLAERARREHAAGEAEDLDPEALEVEDDPRAPGGTRGAAARSPTQGAIGGLCYTVIHEDRHPHPPPPSGTR